MEIKEYNDEIEEDKINVKKYGGEEMEMKNIISSLESNFLNKNDTMDIDLI